jgi:hypothetical protein
MNTNPRRLLGRRIHLSNSVGQHDLYQSARSKGNLSHSEKKLNWYIIGLVGLVGMLVVSCNEAFSPKAPFEVQPVVYSVLSTDSSKQFVRVYTTYDVQGYEPYDNPADTPVLDASVVITGRRGEWTFRDTLIPRPYEYRYRTPVHVYVTDWRPEPGEAYTLLVTSEQFRETSASITLPARSQSATWSPSAAFLLDFPDTAKHIYDVTATFAVSPSVTAWLPQVVLYYLVETGEDWREQKMEIPVASTPRPGGYSVAAVYCPRAYLSSILNQVHLKYLNTRLRFNRISFRLVQMEASFYTYYNIVRRAQDTLTTRSELPDFTNLSKGYGVFAGCTVDSLVHYYPSDFVKNQ